MKWKLLKETCNIRYKMKKNILNMNAKVLTGEVTNADMHTAPHTQWNKETKTKYNFKLKIKKVCHN